LVIHETEEKKKEKTKDVTFSSYVQIALISTKNLAFTLCLKVQILKSTGTEKIALKTVENV
jgi:hypothetical protein